MMPIMVGDHAGADRADRGARGLRAEQQADGAAAHARRRRVEQPGLQHRADGEQEEAQHRDEHDEPDVPPAKTMNRITTAVIDMLDMMICRRPIVSDRWPAIGAAIKPATCNANMQAPIQSGE